MNDFLTTVDSFCVKSARMILNRNKLISLIYSFSSTALTGRVIKKEINWKRKRKRLQLPKNVSPGHDSIDNVEQSICVCNFAAFAGFLISEQYDINEWQIGIHRTCFSFVQRLSKTQFETRLVRFERFNRKTSSE